MNLFMMSFWKETICHIIKQELSYWNIVFPAFGLHDI